MLNGLDDVSFPAFIGHFMGNVSQSAVSEALHTHQLTGNPEWGPGSYITSSPGNPEHMEF